MNKKLTVALAIVGVLAVTIIVGLVSAQVLSSTPNGTSGNGASSGFFGWMGRMMDFRGSSYYGTGTPAIQGQPENITVANPKTGTTTTYQGYYGDGGCMGGFFP